MYIALPLVYHTKIRITQTYFPKKPIPEYH